MSLIHRIALAIRIRIHATFPKRTRTIRTVKPHHHWIELPIAVPQMIMPGHRIRPFAVEAQQTEQAVFRWAMAVGRVGEGMGLSRVEGVQHRTLLISRQQGGIAPTTLRLLLSQQLIFMLENTGLHQALDFSCQSALAIKALGISFSGWRTLHQAVQRIVMVATQYGFAR
ncbi:hypothetical protein BLL42_16065 [Pseudomonas frederiksbergensis]|uniref:Uncharacterized protein n=1 Tax=Pseudomonas frederiksbergensis TaxID=104087 RepID=A0A1J0EM38_9PSED|nr:hypothetical protein BLL42_16065 [Pseudomonas frederiksbergensis]